MNATLMAIVFAAAAVLAIGFACYVMGKKNGYKTGEKDAKQEAAQKEKDRLFYENTKAEIMQEVSGKNDKKKQSLSENGRNGFNNSLDALRGGVSDHKTGNTNK